MPSFSYALQIPTPIPKDLVSLFSQSDGNDIVEPPSKKRKTQDKGSVFDTENASHYLPQYLTATRLSLKLTFDGPPPEHNSIGYDASLKIPTFLYIQRRYNPNSPPSVFEIQSYDCRLVIETPDLGEYNPFIHYIGSLRSIYSTFKKVPSACYRSFICKDPEDGLSFLLDVQFLWHDSLRLSEKITPAVRGAAARYFPGGQPFVDTGRFGSLPDWTPNEFYHNVHVPTTQVNLSAIKGFESIKSQLFPFQERTVGWLLRREGIEVLPDGTLRSLVDKYLPFSFIQTTDADGRPCFISRLLCIAVSDLSAWPYASQINGGVLAEEMGLGKTVELLSLICLHKRPQSDISAPYPGAKLYKSGATLIITPAAILEQWKQEISKHAPSLRFAHYKGIQNSDLPDEAMLQHLASQDIVLTTYNVLQREVHYAEDPPDRSLRHRSKAPRRKSPLVQISWWRVCIDEAQMVESGVTNAARVARIIPRCNAWAVTVEEQRYEQLFQQMCDECGLDSNGCPVGDPDTPWPVEKMRSWLTRLRQACLHPEITVSNTRRVFGSGPLRSVAEVLEVMIDQNEVQIRSEERTLLLSQLRRGQLLENAEAPKEALKLWEQTLSAVQEIVADCRLQLAEILEGMENEESGNLSISDTEDEEAEGEEKNRIGTCRQRLHGALELEHMCKFFIASAFYQIKTDERFTKAGSEAFKDLERLEEENYEAAKLIRREMLTETSHKVNKHINVVRAKAKQQGLVQIPRMAAKLDPGGIESQRILDHLDDFCEAINRHTAKFNKWRDHMVKLILRPLVDEEDATNLQGNEYESSTKVQDEMYVYMEALRAMVADHHDAITGQTNALVKHEMTQALACEKLKVPKELGSLRGILNDLRTLVVSLEWQESGGSARARAELAIVEDLHKAVSTMFSTHSKVVQRLEKEIIMFQKVTNRRLEYYRHLQQISDTVAPYDETTKGEPLDREQFQARIQAEERIKVKASGLKAKRRYLIHLRDDVTGSETSRICIICQSNFEIGVLTVCGHKYCKECLRHWWRQHRSCPTCKTRLRSNELHQITYKPSELVAQEEKTSGHLESDHAMKNAIYSDIESRDLKEIKDIDIDGSFGTKIDTLARHLIWLRHHDPGAKSIVFSQYKSFLGILANAFKRFKIEFSSIDSPDGIERFKKEPSVECFLLHAKAHSSGLNLVNATHVFLCEPLINTAIELQAIARVHRIGQHRETTVWMYLVSDSVEESIYQISVSRRLEHIARKRKQVSQNGKIPRSGINGNGAMGISDLTEIDIDSANSLEMQDAALGKMLVGRATEGENVDDDDVWRCLFGGPKKAGFLAEEGTIDNIHMGVDRMLRADAAERRRDIDSE
ncbi:predicted protein [Uncinocarpus reesii 1704]|uniref:RING-type domain-containing protein n=1 Tax=Uncinocarpus reesii (strain UAMH 1704) TaxID=336963 RepID=C4JXR3_UNCRE|nr:uncharacterized protein UREG_07851 [Uncinocarpus reesii 1704]EEP82986.1 predicted protein [Uncinocarpus reesii 1704]